MTWTLDGDGEGDHLSGAKNGQSIAVLGRHLVARLGAHDRRLRQVAVAVAVTVSRQGQNA